MCEIQMFTYHCSKKLLAKQLTGSDKPTCVNRRRQSPAVSAAWRQLWNIASENVLLHIILHHDFGGIGISFCYFKCIYCIYAELRADGANTCKEKICVTAYCRNTNAHIVSIEMVSKGTKDRVWLEKQALDGPSRYSYLCSVHFELHWVPFRHRFDEEQMGKKSQRNRQNCPPI